MAFAGRLRSRSGEPDAEGLEAGRSSDGPLAEGAAAPLAHAGDVIQARSMAHRANAGVRAAMLRHMQQTGGNRAAQRTVGPGPTSASAVVQRTCSCGGSCEDCRAAAAGQEASLAGVPAAPDEERRVIQPYAAAGPVAASRISGNGGLVPGSHGEPLDRATRSLMEPRFGRELGDIRVHTDAPAADAAEALHAEAFTSGADLFFADRRYAPHSP
jgi:hypothetical protein